jgi:hypothetical protein
VCLLCGIIAGRKESTHVYDDERVLAIMDLYPVTPGHLFVFPRAHVDSLEALDEDLGVTSSGWHTVWRSYVQITALCAVPVDDASPNITGDGCRQDGAEG